MTPLKRVAAVTAPLLLALSLTACGGGASGAPDDASKEDFCEAFTSTPEGGDSDDVDANIDAAHDYGDKLADVGTPSDIDGDARDGFEAYVDAIKDLDKDDIDEFEDAENADDVFGDDGDKVTAFITEASTLCADA